MKRVKKIPLWDDPPPARTLTPPLDGEKFVMPHPELNDTHIRERIYQDKFKVAAEACVSTLISVQRKKSAVTHLVDDINSFEKKIHNEIDNATNEDMNEIPDSNVDTIKSFLATKAKLDPLTHIKGLKNLIPSSDNAERQAKQTVERIKVS